MENELNELTPEQIAEEQKKNRQIISDHQTELGNRDGGKELQEIQHSKANAVSTEVKEKSNEDGSLQDTHATKDAEDFGVKENLQDAGKAVVTGVQNAWNNTIDLGKYFDAKFYAERNEGQDPYSFASGLKFNAQQMPKTRWGMFLRDFVDMGVGFVGVGKIGMGIKGIRGVMMAGQTVNKAGKIVNVSGKAALAKRLAVDAGKGAAVDVWDSTQTTEEGIVEGLIKSNPVLAQNLLQLEDGRDLSPAHRTFLNLFESMGIGAAAGGALEAAGVGYRKLKGLPSTAVTKPTENIADSMSTIGKTLVKSEAAEYQAKTLKVTGMSKTKYEADYFKSLKRKGVVDEDITIGEWRETWKNPSKVDATNESWYKPSWDQLDEAVKQDLVIDMAAGKNIDFGDTRNYAKFNVKQGEQYLDIGADQLEVDLGKGTPRAGAYYSAD
jgi:hypothetical protein